MNRYPSEKIILLLNVAACLLTASSYLYADEQSARQLFVAQVRPLLEKKCLGCHGEGEADELQSGFDMRSREGLLQGGELGPALVPGDPQNSAIYKAVLRSGDLVMPPKERNRLTSTEIAMLKEWITAGAPWDTPLPTSTASGTIHWEKYAPEDLWAFQPLKKPSIPGPPAGSEAESNPIDSFISEKLRAQKLVPAPPADRRTLIRRATFDLIGLPPTPQQVDEFLADRSPDAYRRLVVRLLESPQYGEQWARHWLDVVRYADTSGFANDYERPNAWRYRDYVIRSFNQDMPYDRFIVEQLAGDELFDSDQQRDAEMLIASGFLRMGPWEHTGMSVKAVTRQQYLDDVTNSMGVTFLAMGLRCARCHDHKFDPIPTRDYYRLQAVFAPVRFADREVAFLSTENVSGFNQGAARSERLLTQATDYLSEVKQKHKSAFAAFLRAKGVDNVKDLPPDQRPKRHEGLDVKDLGLQKIFSKRRDYFQRELKRYKALAFSTYSGPDNQYTSNRLTNMMVRGGRNAKVDDVFVLPGGSLAAPGERVTPGVLSAVYRFGVGGSANDATMIPETMRGRRLALARWIASPENPLTARVIVNRVWQSHFGKGIAQNPNNFGKMGSKPTHPQLLDWLATEFIERGWSIKQLHRLMMTSAAYQRSGRYHDIERLQRVDPGNNLLAYFPPRRLSAEELRDSMLAVSGKLNLEQGGPGIFPEINWEVARQPRHIMGSVAPAYQPSPTPRQRNRRTIYAFRYRTLADPMLEVFNRPGSDVSCERRDSTTVTPQVFALFNGQATHHRALALADRLIRTVDDPGNRIVAAFRLLYGREPTDQQLQQCLRHVAQMTEHHSKHPPTVTELPTSVRRMMIEELTGDAYVWDEKLDLMDQYQRDLMPWDVDPPTRAWADLCLVLLNSNEFVYVY